MIVKKKVNSLIGNEASMFSQIAIYVYAFSVYQDRIQARYSLEIIYYVYWAIRYLRKGNMIIIMRHTVIKCALFSL